MRTHFRSLILLATTLGLATALPPQGVPPVADGPGDLFAVLRATPNVGKFLRVVQLASAEDALKTAGGTTLLVPTDEAFAVLPSDVQRDIFERSDRDRLRALLRHHKIEWNVTPLSMWNARGLMNQSGRLLPVVRAAGDTWVGSAQVLRDGIEASNGRIYLVDRVILPEKRKLMKALELHDEYERFVQLVRIAGLTPLLDEDGPMTVFAPTDDAFSRLTKYQADFLFDRSNDGVARAFVLAHVVPGLWTARAAIVAGKVPGSSADEIEVRVRLGRIAVGSAVLTDSDLMTDNGVLHGLDRPLVEPPRGDG